MGREVKKGDSMEPTETSDSGSRPALNDPEVARQETLGEEIMRDDREVLRELAK